MCSAASKQQCKDIVLGLDHQRLSYGLLHSVFMLLFRLQQNQPAQHFLVCTCMESSADSVTCTKPQASHKGVALDTRKNSEQSQPLGSLSEATPVNVGVLLKWQAAQFSCGRHTGSSLNWLRGTPVLCPTLFEGSNILGKLWRNDMIIPAMGISHSRTQAELIVFCSKSLTHGRVVGPASSIVVLLLQGAQRCARNENLLRPQST